MIYVILGMHKSGTSLVAELLHKTGISMVDAAQGDDYESGAYFERQSCYDLNLSLLGWDGDEILFRTLPSNLTLNPENQRRMTAIIAENTMKYADWGFKDPRTCLTYPLWAQNLPEHRLIIVFRPIEALWHRYQYFGFRFWKHWQRALMLIRTWCDYNAAILTILSQTPHDYLVLSYTDLLHNEAEFQHLEDFINCPLVDVRKQRRSEKLANYPVLQLTKGYFEMRHGKRYENIYKRLNAKREC